MSKRFYAAGVLSLLLIGLVIAAAPAWAIKVYVNPSIQTGNYSPDGAYQEGSNMQDVANKLMGKLTARGFEARNSVWMDLGPACTDSNNWGANCFVSLHTDAASSAWSSAHGTRGFFHQSSGGWHDDRNVDFAGRIAARMAEEFNRNGWGRGYNLGTQADYPWCGWNMYVLAPWNQVAIPSTLIEGLYHTNYDDVYRILLNNQGHEAYAEGVFEGICDYYGWSWGPPFRFDTSVQGWYAGNSSSATMWASPDWGWNGALYFDQTGNDCFVYSPTTTITGANYPVVVNVDFYPQNGTRATHDIKMYWKTNADNTWNEAKSSTLVNYTAQNAWTTINLDVNNSNWWNQAINQLRLDTDQVNSSTRYIINHIVVQNQLWYDFNSDVQGWTAGHSLTAPWWTNSGWPGVLVTDQTGPDAYMYGPSIGTSANSPYRYIGGANDVVHVRVYPQNGNTANHEMRIYWIHEGDGTWNDAKSTPVTFTGQNQWVDVYLPVGQNSAWRSSHMTQLRLDFDHTNNTQTTWIVDFIRVEATAGTSTPTTPTASASATGTSTINVSWTASTVNDGSGISSYEVYRNGSLLTTVSGTTLSFGDSGLAQGTQYTYKVRAKSGNNVYGAFSADASATTWATPTTPTTTATATGVSTIDVSWTAATVSDGSGIANYEIYRNGSFLATVFGTTFSFIDSGLSSYTQYTYTVRAKSGHSIYGNFSTGAVATTFSTPTVPGNVVATSANYNISHLTWSASSDPNGVSNYEIWRNGVALTTVSGTTLAFDDSGLAQGTTYSYQVRARNSQGVWSDLSTAYAVKTWSILTNDNFANMNNWTASKVADGTVRGCTANSGAGSNLSGGSGAPCAKSDVGSITTNGSYSYVGYSSPFAVGYIQCSMYDGAASGNSRNGIAFRKSTNDDIATPRLVYFVGMDSVNSATAYTCGVYGLSGGWVKHATGGTRTIGWHRFVVSIDGTSIMFYVDGALKDTIVEPAEKTDGVNRYYIGNNYNVNLTANYDDFFACFPTPPVPAPGTPSVTSTSITWTWTEGPSDYEQGFNIEDTNGTVIGTAGRNTTSWAETGLAPNTTYTRVITAWNGPLESPVSITVSATTAP